MRKFTKLTLILVLMLFLSSFAVNAATTGLSGLLVTNVNALDFKVNIDSTNAVTNIVKMNLSRSQFQAPVVPGDVWTLTNISGVYGGSTNIITNSIWGIDGSGHITPIVTNNAVIATNIVRAGHGVNTGSETWQTKSIILTNGVNYLPVADWSQLQLISPSSDPSLVQIVLSNGWNTVQHLEIFNLTNAVPSQGAFTLTNLTPIPDSLGGGVVKLINNENWVATNGCGIELRFISPDWVEQFRSDVSGNPTFISNTFNNITVISNTTLRGRITINNINVTTNDLWKTNFTGTSTNLLPVDPSLYVLAPNGYLAGANTAVAVNNALASTRDSNLGELDANGISIISRNSLANTEAAFSIGGAILGGYSEALYSKDTTTRWEIGRSVDSTVGADFYIGTNGIGGLVKYIDLSPNAADGTAIIKLGTAATHTTGNLFEFANNTTNKITGGFDGILHANRFYATVDPANSPSTAGGLLLSSAGSMFAYATNVNEVVSDSFGLSLWNTKAATALETNQYSTPLWWKGSWYDTASHDLRVGLFLKASGSYANSKLQMISSTNGLLNNVTNFSVSANSGYDGTGNLFLSSDGTYKAAGGGGSITGAVVNVGPAPVVGVPAAFADTTGTNIIASYTGELEFTKTGDQTLSYTNNSQVLIWNSATNCNVFLPATATNGWRVVVKNLGAGNLIVTNTGGLTIDGQTSLSMPIGCFGFGSDGSNYRTLRISPNTVVAQNLVYASPNGATGVPSMRALVAGDLPSAIVATKAFQQYQGSLTHAGTVTLDFDAATTLNSLTITGNVTLAFSNVDTNRTYGLLIKGCSTNSTITWPSGVHGQIPVTCVSNKWVRCTLEAWGTGSTNVIISGLEDL